MVRRVASPRFVGRSEELAALTDGLARAAAGEPAAVLIGGEAGVGKSRLLAELEARAVAAGTRVLVGGCVALRSGALPLLPIAEALRRLTESDDEDLQLVLAEAPPALAALLPRWGAGPEPDRAASPEALFEHVLTVLRRVAQLSPVVLAVEDVHWADRSTLDFLGLLLRTLGDARLLILVTYRDDEPDANGLREWLGDAGRVQGVERLRLPRLSREGVEELLEGVIGEPAPAELAAGVFARSGGNAFMAEELLAAARAGDPDQIPESLRDTLLARLGMLSDVGRALVTAAAAAGGSVHHQVLGVVAGRPPEAFEAALADALQRHVLVLDRAGERLAFRHALLREVAYEQLLPSERARIHTVFADAIERAPELAGGNAATVAAEVAHHARESGDAARALVTAVRAGMEAERLRAPAEAREHFERALALWRPAGVSPALTRAEVAARAAAAAEAAGLPERAVALVEQAIDHVDDPVRAALLHERRGWYLSRVGRQEDCLEALETAVALVPSDPPSPERARVLAFSAYLLGRAYRVEEARERAHEALRVARLTGALVAEGTALTALAAAHTALGELVENVESSRGAIAIFDRVGDDLEGARGRINLSDGLLALGRADEALEVALEGMRRCSRAGLTVTYGNIACTNASLALMHTGRWDEAEGLLADALARPAAELGAAGLLLAAGRLALRRGDLEAAEARFRKVPEQVVGGLPADWRWDLEGGRAELAVYRGDPEGAVSLLAEPLAVLAEVREPVFLLRLCAVAARAHADHAEAWQGRDARAASRDRDRADQVAGVAARARGNPGPEQLALLAVIEAERARAGGGAQPAPWAAAVTACERWGDAYETAYTCWRHGEALLAARAPRAEAVAVLRRAHETAERLGARPLLAEIDALARRARVSLAAAPEPAAPAADGWGLTAREREVLELVAEGRTNRQIAEALFISVKTAGVHVSSILRKLDASTRAEAAGIAHRAGLLAGNGPRPGSAHRV